MTKTIIIGAGPAGLAAAIKLAESKENFEVFEKADRVGGLATTYKFIEGDDVFLTDNGPHRFYSKNNVLYEFIEDLLKDKWILVKRQTRQYIDGKFYDYPVKPLQALKNIGPTKAMRILVDYFKARIIYGLLRKKIENFEDFVVANFGRTLGEFNMINYTEKIWGVPARTIHADWAKQRIHGLNLSAVVKGALTKLLNIASSRPKTMIEAFYYPESGTGLIYQTIKEKLESAGYKINLNTRPVKICHDHQRITRVIFQQGEKIIEKDCDTLVESIPIKDFVSLLDPLPPPDVLEANEKLYYRDQVYVFLTINKPSITGDQWIYLPDKEIPIGRVSEMKNFSSKMSPPNATSLFIELFCFKGDEIWNMKDNDLVALTVGHLEKLGFFKKEELRRGYVIRMEKVYPIYDLNYKEYLSVVKNYLNNFENLFYVGRPGRFRYNNQDHSLEMGFLTARSIIEKTKYDLDTIGGEQEYFEKGHINVKSKNE